MTVVYLCRNSGCVLCSFNFNNLLAASSVIFYLNNFTNKLKLALKLILDINKYTGVLPLGGKSYERIN